MRSGLRLAIEMLEMGGELRARRHRREHPEASDEEVRTVVRAWLADRSTAPDGDAVGRVKEWPRKG